MHLGVRAERDEVEDLGDTQAKLRHPGGCLQVRFAGAGRLSLEDSTYCPEFGRAEANRCLVFAAHGAELELGFCAVVGEGPVRYDLRAGAEAERTRYTW